MAAGGCGSKRRFLAPWCWTWGGGLVNFALPNDGESRWEFKMTHLEKGRSGVGIVSTEGDATLSSLGTLGVWSKNGVKYQGYTCRV